MSQPRRSWKPGLSVDGVLGLVLELPQRSPAIAMPRRLDSLFRELAKDAPGSPADDIEDLIWAVWSTHPDDDAMADMTAAIEAIAASAFDLARPILDRIIARHPDWSEAWNKRATLSFIEKRDAESLADIEETLKLEPRHFGAISGFGQICLRHGKGSEARAAFQIALSINPHLGGLKEIIDELKPCLRTLH